MQHDDPLANHSLLQIPGYDPDNLLNVLLEKLQLKNDRALSRLLGVAPPVISNIRNRKLPVGAGILIKMNELCGVSIRDLRVLMGDRRAHFNDRQWSRRVDHLGVVHHRADAMQAMTAMTATTDHPDTLI